MSAKGKKKNIIVRILSNVYTKTFIAMGVIVAVLIGLTLFGLNIYTKHGESVEVPSVLGMQVEEAVGVFAQHDLRCEVVDSIFLTGGVPGGITDQIPEEGSRVKKNRTVFLTMQAKSVERITIPALIDFSQRQAVATLNSLGFTNIQIKEVPSAYKGLVLDVTYKGNSIEPNTKLPKGDPIGLTVGAGGEAIIDSLIDVLPGTVYNDDVQRQDQPAIDNSFY